MHDFSSLLFKITIENYFMFIFFFALTFFVHLHNYYFIVFISNSMCSSLIFFSYIKALCSFAINKIYIKTQTYLTHEVVDNYKSKMKKANYRK